MRSLRTFVAGAVAGMIGLGLVFVGPIAPASAAEPDTIYSLVNQARASNGKSALYRNSALDQVAVNWANQMASTRRLEHNPSYANQIPAGWSRAGENVAYGQPSGTAVHNAWMASEGHRANILGDYTDVGIAFVQAAGTTWSVEVFGKYANRVSPASQSFVKALYADVLGRTPGDSEVTHWMGRLAIGESRVQVASGFVNSDEYRLARINRAYVSILGRTGETAGVQGWLNGMRQGLLGPDDVEKTFLASQEFYNQSGGTDSTYVAALYRRLLSREGSSGEVRGWADQVPRAGRPAIVAAFWNSMETARQRVGLMYVDYLGRQPDSAGATGWATMAILSGDGAVRWSIIGSDEYVNRAVTRFP